MNRIPVGAGPQIWPCQEEIIAKVKRNKSKDPCPPPVFEQKNPFADKSPEREGWSARAQKNWEWARNGTYLTFPLLFGQYKPEKSP